jgi:nucleoside-diphosphate-sugar epimerase
MQQAFVTGGSGFVGRRLLDELRRGGVAARALVRSVDAERIVRDAGAEPVRGALDDTTAMRSAMRGCEVAFHVAAVVSDWGDADDFFRVNVAGTENVLAAARTAGVARVVHVSTEAVLAGPAPIVRANEDTRRPAQPYGPYALTKGLAEDRVLAANQAGLETVIVRPRFIWGRGDTSVLPKLVSAVRSHRFRWIDHGRYLSSTTHVANVVEGLLLAAERGRPGAIYFLTDGPPVEFRAFVTRMLETQGVRPGNRSLPRRLAWRLAVIVEAVWQRFHLRTTPPITRMVVKMLGEEVTLDDSRARRELGYLGRMSVEAGLRDMQGSTTGDQADAGAAASTR